MTKAASLGRGRLPRLARHELRIGASQEPCFRPPETDSLDKEFKPRAVGPRFGVPTRDMVCDDYGAGNRTDKPGATTCPRV